MESLSVLMFSFVNSPKSLAIFLGLILLFLVIALISYVYLSLVFFSIGKKCKIDSPRLALVPIFGPAIIAYKASRMHWLPWLLLLFFVPGFLLTAFVSLNVFIATISLISFGAFFVYSILWNTRMFRILKRPGFWAYSLIFFPVYMILAGISLKKPNNFNNSMKKPINDNSMKGGK